MAILDVLTLPDPRLKEVALPVDKVERDVRRVMDDLLETLYHIDAGGLAATQVGISKRVIVVDISESYDAPSSPLLMANPQIHWVSSKTQVTKEGCFSVPGFFENVTRPLEIEVSYLDENNHPQLLKPRGLLADCIQHEIDHLNGVLFLDHLSVLKRQLILKKFFKGKKSRL